MAKIISIHEYELKPGVDPATFERAIKEAEKRGLFQMPGLIEYHFIKGIRGTRKGKYAAIWVYESLQAWEKLWGPIDAPHGKDRYPNNWKIWENEILAPLLDRDPDSITFSSYIEI